MQGKYWCFTLNNYTQADIEHLHDLAPAVDYLIFGKETAPTTGTPHLQGYVAFKTNKRLAAAKTALSANPGLHLERKASNSSHQQAADYCKKDGDFEEYGVLPTDSSGKRSDWDRYKEWVVDLGRLPTKRELVAHFPGLFARYYRACYDIARYSLPAVDFTGDNEPRLGWQFTVCALIQQEEAHQRRIHFVVDPAGGAGKSWVCRWAISKYPDKVQVFRIGKRDDIAYAIDETKSVFLFDVPRGEMMYLQYSVLESMKDQQIFSPKYESASKILRTCPHVIVFTNEEPDMTKLTEDRYNIIRVNQN